MSTMENADAKGEKSQTNEPNSSGITNSLLINREYASRSEKAEEGKNEEDSVSNENFLKRKREAELNVSLLQIESRENNGHNSEGKN